MVKNAKSRSKSRCTKNAKGFSSSHPRSSYDEHADNFVALSLFILFSGILIFGIETGHNIQFFRITSMGSLSSAQGFLSCLHKIRFRAFKLFFLSGRPSHTLFQFHQAIYTPIPYFFIIPRDESMIIRFGNHAYGSIACDC